MAEFDVRDLEYNEELHELKTVIEELIDERHYKLNDVVTILKELVQDDPLVEKITKIYERGNSLLTVIQKYRDDENSNTIKITWHIYDVINVRPDLNDEQAMCVLEEVKRKHDAIVGVNWDVLKIWADELYPLDSLKQKTPYVSVWDGGVEVATQATVNIKTGEITDIESADVNGLEVCEEQYIVMNDERVYVYEDENGFDYWADLKGGM